MARVLLYIFLFSSTAWADIQVSDLSGHTTKCKLAYGIMTGEATEAGFLEKIRKHPDDTDLLMIYSEWLEQNGKPDEGEFIRLQILNEPVRRRIRKETWDFISSGGKASFFDNTPNDAEYHYFYSQLQLGTLLKEKKISKDESDSLLREQELLQRNRKDWIPNVFGKVSKDTLPVSYRFRRGLLETAIFDDKLQPEVLRTRIKSLFEKVPTMKYVTTNIFDLSSLVDRMFSSGKIPLGEPFSLYSTPYTGGGAHLTITRTGTDLRFELEGWLARPLYFGVFRSNGTLMKVVDFNTDGETTVSKVPEGSYVRWIGYGGTP